jgi:delta 1-pyrroline-5-carboxylate dehydrogenase
MQLHLSILQQLLANLPSSAALMGNVVVWKPSDSQVFSAKIIIDVFKEAGVPDGVINVVFGDPVMITDTVLASPDFAGIHLQVRHFLQRNLEKNRRKHSQLTKHIQELLEKLVEKISLLHIHLQM